jgi:hypothetical protein
MRITVVCFGSRRRAWRSCSALCLRMLTTIGLRASLWIWGDEPCEEELLALEDEPPEEGEPRPALSCLVPPAVEIELPQFWDRCWMRIGDASPRYKCYFDQGTHQSNRPRGWVSCEAHQCIKYMWADTVDRRRSLCAFAYAWLTLYHSDHPCKGDHLSFTPTTEQVKAVADNLCLESF